MGRQEAAFKSSDTHHDPTGLGLYGDRHPALDDAAVRRCYGVTMAKPGLGGSSTPSRRCHDAGVAVGGDAVEPAAARAARAAGAW